MLTKKFLLCALASTALLLTGCSEQTNSDIDFGQYQCTSEISNPITRHTISVTSIDNGETEQVTGYSSMFVQVDDVSDIQLGKTTVGELKDKFKGTYMAEKQVEGETVEYEKDIYTYTCNFDETKEQDYEPIRLIDMNVYSQMDLTMYKYGVAYAKFHCYRDSYYNTGILQESDFVITGIEIAQPSKSAFADEYGLNKAAKENCYLSGGYRMDGDTLNYDNIKTLLSSYGLKETEDLYADNESAYIVRSIGSVIEYMARINCSDMNETDDAVYVNQMTISYAVEPGTQECIYLSVDITNGQRTFMKNLYSVKCQ